MNFRVLALFVLMTGLLSPACTAKKTARIDDGNPSKNHETAQTTTQAGGDKNGPKVGEDKKNIALEDIWMFYKFMPSFPEEFNWMKDDRFYSVMEENKIIRYSIIDQKPVATLLDIASLTDSDTGDKISVSSYGFSEDEQKIMLKTKVKSIYRHSTKEQVFVYETSGGKLTKLHGGELIMYATFSHDGSKIAYVFDNNLYYYDFVTGKESQITQDGKWNFILNGGTDWVHEEEFAFAQAFNWAPDDSKIAFYRFDESEVKEFHLAMYGSLYPTDYSFKYPKAGEKNAVTTLHFYDLNSRAITQADIGSEKDQYIPRIKWTSDPNILAAMRMNRLQNQVEILMIDAKTGQSSTILQENTDTYINEVTDQTWTFPEGGKQFIWQSDRSGYNHLYLYDLTGKLIRQITQGQWEVAELCGVDAKNGVVHYLSTENSPLDRHLYKINLDGKGKTWLTTGKPGWHEVTFSSNHNYYMDSWSSIDAAPQAGLFDNKGKLVMMLDDNAKLTQTMEEYDLQPSKFFRFKTDQQVELEGWMIKPPNFDPNKKYPVFMYVYGGPGSQTVMNKFGFFNYFWFQMLAQKGYIVVSVDNRGTGGRGSAFKKCTYADLGNLETQDQIATAKYLGAQSYVDASRIGIWGWSYGGYMTSLCLTKGAETFKMGMAVAPVTNWRFYDTIYTERYLKTPQENAKGYDDNSPINFADKLKGAYLLVHGTADDNVHYQNSMEWVDALVKANKQFDMAFYPNKNHGIYGGVTRFHLYRKMTDFLLENL